MATSSRAQKPRWLAIFFEKKKNSSTASGMDQTRIVEASEASVGATSVYYLESSADVEIHRQLGVGEIRLRQIEDQGKSS